MKEIQNISETEKEKVKKEAKKLMDEFYKELSKVKDKGEHVVERDEFERQEWQGKAGNSDFRKAMFENAPSKNKDFIIAEKKGW